MGGLRGGGHPSGDCLRRASTRRVWRPTTGVVPPRAGRVAPTGGARERGCAGREPCPLPPLRGLFVSLFFASFLLCACAAGAAIAAASGSGPLRVNLFGRFAPLLAPLRSLMAACAPLPVWRIREDRPRERPCDGGCRPAKLRRGLVSARPSAPRTRSLPFPAVPMAAASPASPVHVHVGSALWCPDGGLSVRGGAPRRAPTWGRWCASAPPCRHCSHETGAHGHAGGGR